jgi:hypothetical protein
MVFMVEFFILFPFLVFKTVLVFLLLYSTTFCGECQEVILLSFCYKGEDCGLYRLRLNLPTEFFRLTSLCRVTRHPLPWNIYIILWIWEFVKGFRKLFRTFCLLVAKCFRSPCVLFPLTFGNHLGCQGCSPHLTRI